MIKHSQSAADNERTGGGKKPVIYAGLAVLAAFFIAAVIFIQRMPVSLSGDTELMISETAETVRDVSDIDFKEAVPLSRDTRKLLSNSVMVMQNPAFMLEGNDSVEPIEIGSPEQDIIVDVIAEEWPEDYPPWDNGYAGMCENWVCDVYHKAGIPTRGSCCAASSRDKHAVDSDDIPVGAMIYSGEDYSSGTICEFCGRDPGHVAIYIGDGRIAGSQTQYIMAIDEFRDMFGYGGWSFSGNSY